MRIFIEWLRDLGFIAAAALALTAYRTAARRSAAAAKLPVNWLLVYLWGRFAARLAIRMGWIAALPALAETLLMVALCWAVIHLVFYLLFERRHAGDPRPPMARLTRDVFLTAIYAVAAIVVFRTHGGANLAGILTTSAVLTAVIGLALQATLNNLFAGIAIQLEHPFGIGDWIAVGPYEGRVISISWKSTRLLNRDRQMVYVPNSMVTASAFQVFTRPDPVYVAKRFIGLGYEAPPDLVIETLLQAIRQLPDIEPNPPPEVWLKSFGDFSVLYEMRFGLADPTRENRVAADLNRSLWYALRRAGLRFPFPIRDVRLAHEERRRIESDRAEDRRRIAARLRALPLLAGLDDAGIDRLALEANCAVYGAGEIVIRRGDPGASLFVILEGRCEVWSGDPERSDRLAEISEGDCFGEMSLLTGEPRSATVRASADTTVLEIEKELFADIMRERPAVVAELASRLEQRRAAGRLQAPLPATTSSSEAGLLFRIRRFLHL